MSAFHPKRTFRFASTVRLASARRHHTRTDGYSVDQDIPLIVASGGVLGNDTDAESSNLTLADGPEHGTITLNADGTFTYVPDEGYYGPDGFSYREGRMAVRCGRRSSRVVPRDRHAIWLHRGDVNLRGKRPI